MKFGFNWAQYAATLLSAPAAAYVAAVAASLQPTATDHVTLLEKLCLCRKLRSVTAFVKKWLRGPAV